jgi:hypothetical protein
MAWSIFTQGGGDGAALTWAENLLKQMGAPVTPGNEQFVYDWEQSEGGGGAYNPLNEGDVPGHPELTTTGSQYGGGAADYANYADGITGAIDYLDMPNYTAVKAAIMANNPTAAKAALIASPWAASHYGYGSAFSNAPLPGQATSLLGDAPDSNAVPANTGSANAQSANWWTNLFSYNGQVNDLKGLFGALTGQGSSSGIATGLQSLFIRGALVVFGAVVLIVGLIRLTGGSQSAQTIVMGPVGKAGKAYKKLEGKNDASDA